MGCIETSWPRTLGRTARALNAEFDQALRHGQTAKMILRLRSVPVRAFFSVGLVAAAPISTDGKFFTLSQEGEPAVILPCYDAPPGLGDHTEEELTDLVAWYPDAPDKWWQRTGLGWALGQHLAEFSFLRDEPIRFHRRPFDWLKACGEGVCMLDGSVTYDRFGQARRIVAEDRAHGLELEKLFEPPILPSPQVVVPKEAGA